MENKHTLFHPDAHVEYYDIAEYCPHCDDNIPVVVNYDCEHLEAVCPVCGNQLMLCTICPIWNTGCDWECDCGCKMDKNNKGWKGGNYGEQKEAV